MIYRFDDYCLDVNRRELRRKDVLVSLEPQVFDVLCYLISNRHRVVSKDDLISAVWGGRIVSESALTTRINAARMAVGDNGHEQRLIKTLLRKGFRFIGEVQVQLEQFADLATPQVDLPLPGPSATLALPERPSIAVLPFQNLTGDPNQEYFADGVVEDIITALSRIRWIFVIARNSSFTYKGRSVNIKQVGRELGVRYILEGSIRRASQRIRITGQLIEAETGRHVWAERYDSDLGDLFDVQDEITTSLVGAIEPSMRTLEIARARVKPTYSLDAYDLYLRALPEIYRFSEAGFHRAEDLLRKAIVLDEHYPEAWVALSHCIGRLAIGGWRPWKEGMIEAREAALRAVTIDPESGTALAAAAWTLALGPTEVRDPQELAQLDRAVEFADRALQFQPNSAQIRTHVAWVFVHHGDSDKAIEHSRAARRMSPIDPLGYIAVNAIAAAHFFASRFEEASKHARQAVAQNSRMPVSLMYLSAALGHLGQQSEARAAVAALLAARPQSSLSRARQNRYRHQWMLDLLIDGLRKAGLPELGLAE